MGFVDLEWIETSERGSNEKFGIGEQGVSNSATKPSWKSVISENDNKKIETVLKSKRNAEGRNTMRKRCKRENK